MSVSRVILPFTDSIYDDRSIFLPPSGSLCQQYKLYCSVGDITNYHNYPRRNRGKNKK